MADRRVRVTLEAQVDAYKRGMDQAAQATDRVADSAEKAGSATQGAGGQVGGARQAFADFGDTMRGINRETPQFAAGMAIVGGSILGVMGNLMKTGIEYNSLQQVAGKALETMTGDAESAANQMDRLDEFASTSPFFRDTWLEAQRQLMAFGMEAEDVVPTLEGVEEAVAAIGGGDQEIRRLVEILGQIEGQGQITGRELQRMGQMGINAADLMGDALGVTGAEIREQITAGALDADTAIKALTDGMMMNFEGSADAIRDTMSGATNDAIAMWRDLGSILAEPFVSADGGGLLVGVMNAVSDAGRAFMELPDIVVQAVGGVVAGVGGLAALGGIWGLLGTQIAGFATGAWNALVAVKDLGAALVNSAGGWRRFATGAGIAVAAIAGLAVLRHVNTDSQDVATSVGDMRRELILAADGAKAFTDIEWSRAGEDSKNHVGSLTEAFQRLDSDGIQGVNDSVNRFFSNLLGIDGAITDLDQNIANIDESISKAFSSGDYEYAAAGFEEVAAAAAEADWTAEELSERMPLLTEAIQDAAYSAGVTADATQLLGIATSAAALEALAAGESWNVVIRAYETGEYMASLAAGEVLSLSDALSQQAEMANAAAEGISNLVEDMNAYSGIALSAEETTDNWLASLRELNENLEDGTYSLDKNTDSGKENRAELRGIAADALEAAAATATQTESLEETNAVVDDAIEALRSAGEAAELSESEIDDMIRTYMGFNDVEPIEVQAENRAKEIFDEVEAQLFDLPDDWEIRISALADDAQEVINAIVEGDHETVVDILGDDALAREVIAAFADGDYEAVARIMADPMEANRVVMEFENGEYVAVADIDGNTNPADVAMAAFLNGDYQTVAEIAGNDAEARATILAFLNGDYQTTADIHGDDGSAQGTMGSFIGTSWQTTVGFNGNDSSARGTMDSFTSTPWSTTAIINGDDGSARGTVTTFTSTPWLTTVGVNGNTSSAQASINGLNGQTVTVRVNALVQRASSLANRVRNLVPGLSGGGSVYGPGTGTSDDIPAMLSNGEHVLTAKDVQAMGGHQNVYQFRSQLHHGPRGRDMRPAYAAGGAVQARQIAAAMQGAGGGVGVQQPPGPRVVFQQTNHNPLRETDIEAARRQVEAIGMDWDMSGMGGDL